MKILQVHKYLYRRAGAEAYMLALAELLAENGQEVALWGTREKFQIPDSRFQIPEDLLVDELHFDRREGLVCDLKKFGHMVWSLESARKFEAVLKRFKPDVVHIHNIYHHISPSILAVAARHRVPIVMTVHDWHLINPNYTLFDHGAICERQGVRAVLHRCIKNSYLMTLADVKEAAIHRALRVYERHVAKFLAPVQFVKEKLVEGGISTDRIDTLPLFVISTKRAHAPEQSSVRGFTPRARGEISHGAIKKSVRSLDFAPLEQGFARDDKKGSYVLFAGRLTVEKGIYLLLEIAKRLPEIKFKIAGTGSEFENVKLKIKNAKLSNVEILGFLEKERLQRVMAEARLVLVPSLWYEISPLAVLEAMAGGKAVMASRIGGIPELIEDGETGFLVDPPTPPPPTGGGGGGRGEWVDKIKATYYDEELLKRVGEAAAQYVKRVHSPEQHYKQMMHIYGEVIR